MMRRGKSFWGSALDEFLGWLALMFIISVIAGVLTLIGKMSDGAHTQRYGPAQSGMVQ
jgi:hypothetical protein